MTWTYISSHLSNSFTRFTPSGVPQMVWGAHLRLLCAVGPRWDPGGRQNRRQKVVNRGALHLCGGLCVRAGGFDIQIYQKFHYFIVFNISIWGAWCCVWGDKPTKAPTWRRGLEANGAIVPLKTYESTFFHHNFVQFFSPLFCTKYRGPARIFLRGWAKVKEAKSVEKEKLLVIRIAKEST